MQKNFAFMELCFMLCKYFLILYSLEDSEDPEEMPYNVAMHHVCTAC